MCVNCKVIAPPPTQGLSSPTFRPPPLDYSLNLPEIYEWHETHSPHHPVFVYPSSSPGAGESQILRWTEVNQLVRKEARRLRILLDHQIRRGVRPVVAIVANCDTITYFTTLMGIARANLTSFPMSPRNSAAAIAHLCTKTGVTHILQGSDLLLTSLIDEVMMIMKRQSIAPLPTVSQLPAFVHPHHAADSTLVIDVPYKKPPMDDVQIYVHSSGSTGFPKPIPWTYRQILQLGYACYFGERDLAGKVLAVHAVPMFHGLGMMQTGWTATTGIALSVFEPSTPAIYPTPENHFEAMAITRSDLVLAVPSIIEAWARDPLKVRWLQGMDGGVIYGGGPLNKEIGDYLVSEGVAVYPLYGTSECGTVNPIIPAQQTMDWEYFRFADNTDVEMIPSGDGTYEFVMLCGPHNNLRVINSSICGRPAYATSDLLQPHPSSPGYWKVYGRKDDQIMHSSGEKTNPFPIENMLNQDPNVRTAVVFGCGQLQAGVLIDPVNVVKPGDQKSVEAFLCAISPTVRKINCLVPKHSRIFPEMVIIKSPCKPFQFTAKGTPRRQVIISDYEAEISALYGGSRATVNYDASPPDVWDYPSTLAYVRFLVDKTLDHILADDDDFFQHGCDSFHATCIRHSLLRVLPAYPQSGGGGGGASNNFVYEHPTIARLTQFIVDLVAKPLWLTTSIEAKIAEMKALVDKYGSHFQERCAAPRPPLIDDSTRPNEVALLTGTTGTLGSHLLRELIRDRRIGTIYAVNRPRSGGSAALLSQQISAFNAMGLDGRSLVASPKVHLLEADLSVSGFGMDPHVYGQITSSVTRVIHNAWPVNFNLALGSFEPSIRALRSLIDFALASTSSPTFYFTSTIGVCRGSTAQVENLLEERIAPEMAIGMGYTESKWVAEEVILQAAQKTNLQTQIIRVGQLTGSGDNLWKVNEWFPSLVRGSILAGALPHLVGIISWIPVKAAAQIIAEFTHNLQHEPIVHLVHPTPVPWDLVEASLSLQLGLPAVPYTDWLAKLSTLEQALLAAPGEPAAQTGLTRGKHAAQVYALLPFFKQAQPVSSSQKEAMGYPTISSVKARRLSRLMRDQEIQRLTELDVTGWLDRWRRVGFLPDQ